MEVPRFIAEKGRTRLKTPQEDVRHDQDDGYLNKRRPRQRLARPPPTATGGGTRVRRLRRCKSRQRVHPPHILLRSRERTRRPSHSCRTTRWGQWRCGRERENDPHCRAIEHVQPVLHRLRRRGAGCQPIPSMRALKTVAKAWA